MHYLRLTPPTPRHYAVSALLLAALLVAVFAFRGLGRWLVVRDTLPERVDVIFTFGGETAREIHAVRLAEQHPEATLVFSAYSPGHIRALHGGMLDTARTVIVDSLRNTWEEVKFLRGWLDGYRAERAKAASVAAESDSLNAILTQVGSGSDGRGGNPKSEIQDTSSAIPDPQSAFADPRSPIRNPGSAISVALVSGPYHMRRIKVAAVRMLKARDLRLYYAPAPLDLYRQTEEQYAHWWREPGLRSLVRIEFGKTLYYLVRL